jgi:hypothetical protein
MPAKGSTGTKRTRPLRSDRGVKLYAPTAAKPFFRVVSAGTVERTSAAVPVESIEAARPLGFDPTKVDAVVARARREADEIFDRMVAWAKTQPHVSKRGEQTMNALCDRRLQELRDKDRALGTYDKNESLLRLYVRPQIGHVDVADWNSAHSQQVIQAARKTCGAERIRDLGSALRSLVTLAHRKPAWLPRDEDPMEEVDYQLVAATQGEAVVYVPVSERPSIQQVESLAVAMGERGYQTMAYLAGRPKQPKQIDRGWGWLCVQVFAKSGTRFGEGSALVVGSFARPRREVEEWISNDLELTAEIRESRVAAIIDLPHGFAIDPGSRVISITEVIEWKNSMPYIAPIELRSSGKVPKSNKTRWTIYPTSLVDPIVERCTELLERFGPDQGPYALMFPACDHAFVLVPVDSRRPNGLKRWQDQDWWNRSDFPRTMYKKAVTKAEHWPATPPFPFENMRHHFATWAKRNGYDDVLITHCMGHASTDYTQKRYFRTGADTIAQGMFASRDL